VLQHFWFLGNEVMAFNDRIAMSIPLKTEFEGAVPGELLLSVLNASLAKNATLTPIEDGTHIELKASRTNLKLGLLAPDSFMFTMPEIKQGKGGFDQLTDAIKCCLRSVTDDTSVPDQLGVTVIPEGDDLRLFSTNSATLTHCRIKAPLKLNRRVVLSQQFCEQLVKLDIDNLELRDDHAIAHGSDVTLFGKFINVPKPLPFPDILEQHIPNKVLGQLYPVPTKLKGILERACIIADAPDVQTPTKIAVKDGAMIFTSIGKFESTKLDDKLTLEDGAEKQSELTIKVQAKHIKAGYGDFKKMVITDSCFVMADNANKVYMVATSEG
jgi:hypothetical protein